MRMTIASTNRFVEIREKVPGAAGKQGPPVAPGEGRTGQSDGGAEQGVKCRIWEGKTASGIPVVVLIPRIAVKNGNDTADFERELVECKEPSADAQAFPLRMIL